MPKTLHNYDQSINYVETIAALAEPINSTLLATHTEYLNAADEDKTATFLGALNLIGETGCKFLYDRIINYIDDVSNIDTCRLDALYSTAATLQVPYKDKQIFDTLSDLTHTSEILQLIVWLMSCNVRNTKHIIKRLNIADTIDTAEFDTMLTRAELFEHSGYIAQDIKAVLKNILIKGHITPPSMSSGNAKPLLGFAWNFFNIVSELIYEKQQLYSMFIHVSPNKKAANTGIHKLDFGKYNFTPHEHTCNKLIKHITGVFTGVSNDIIRHNLPFLFNDELFDPIAAAEDILFNSGAIETYTDTQQAEIRQCMTAINTTGQSVLDSYSDESLHNIQWLNRLNSHVYADERLLFNVINDVKRVCNINPLEGYISVNGDSLDNVHSNDTDAMQWWRRQFVQLSNATWQFKYLNYFSLNTSTDASTAIFDVDAYVDDIYTCLLKIGDKLSALRDNLKLLTLRNSFKGTSAIIQFAVAEYLNEHLPDIVDSSIDIAISNVVDKLLKEQHADATDDELINLRKHYTTQYRLNVKSDETLLSNLETIYKEAQLDASDVNIIEYWDQTEYYGRTKHDAEDEYPADWLTDPRTTYGLTEDDDIVKFYTHTLALPTDTFKSTISAADVDISTDIGMSTATTKLIAFLTHVYNAGIFNRTLPSNFQKVFSGSPANAILQQFYTNYKTYDLDTGIDRISKQVHPYIWNFTTSDNAGAAFKTRGSSTYALIGSGAVTRIQHEVDIELLNAIISSSGSILDQWRLNIDRWLDDSNYWTRYEAYDHTDNECVRHYDGYVYPPFAFDLYNVVNDDNNTSIDAAKMLDTPMSDNVTIYDRWYRERSKLILHTRKRLYDRENTILSLQIQDLIKTVDYTNYSISAAVVETNALERYVSNDDSMINSVPIDDVLNAIAAEAWDPTYSEVTMLLREIADYIRRSSSIAAVVPVNRAVLRDYTVDHQAIAYAVGVVNGRATLLYKEAEYPFMRPLRQTVINDDGDTEQLGITFINEKNERLDDLFSNIDIAADYTDDKNHFPHVCVTEDGEYLLLKLDSDVLGFFASTTYVNDEGFSEKALQLKHLIYTHNLLGIGADKTLHDLSTHMTEGGLKTLHNNICILLTDVNGTQFVEHLIFIGPSSCRYTKQIINCTEPDIASKLTAGLTLTDSAQAYMQVIVSTFGLTSDSTDYDIISGFKSDMTDDVLSTDMSNTAMDNTSFDVFKQFVHILANSNAPSNSISLQDTVGLTKQINAIYPCFVIPTEAANTKTFTLTSTQFEYDADAELDLYSTDVMPFARRFNINSDAGFNPCYIGYNGRLILPDRFNQFALAKTLGVAVELLGPQTRYHDVEDDADTDIAEYSVRIHEIDYAAVTEIKTPAATPFDIMLYNATAAAGYSVYADDVSCAYMSKRPRLFTCTLDGLYAANNTEVDISSDDAVYVMNKDRPAFVKTDAAVPDENHVGNAFIMFKTNDDIWLPFALQPDMLMADDTRVSTFHQLVYNVVFCGVTNTTAECRFVKRNIDGSVDTPYIFNTLSITRKAANKIEVKLTGSTSELLNVEVVIVGVKAAAITNAEPTRLPTFMLTDTAFAAALTNAHITNDISMHLRANHPGYDADFFRDEHFTHNYLFAANGIEPDSDSHDSEYRSYVVDADALKNGSLTLSLLEQDSVELGYIMPDQHDLSALDNKFILTEMLNELFRAARINANPNATPAELYVFRHYQFTHLRLLMDDDTAADNTMYYVQLSKTAASADELDYLRYLTYSAWRRAEDATAKNASYGIESTVPSNVKITEADPDIIGRHRPVYMHASGMDISNINSIIPMLGIRWQTVTHSREESIELRFDNATLADSVFKNPNNGLTYVSLANAASALQLKTNNQPTQFSIVSPLHIIAGSTIFTDIPLASLLLTNVSDDKPKFMMTVRDNQNDTVNNDAYALVFNTGSTPEIANDNTIVTYCYVAKLADMYQQNIPQIDTAVQLSQLIFNMNICNILNTNLTDEVNARDPLATVQIATIHGKNPTHIVKKLRQAAAIRNVNNETIKIAIKTNTKDDADDAVFTVADLLIHFHDVTKYTLKNALITAANRHVVALDKDGNKLYIAKVFGCDFNKIGIKRVLGSYDGLDAAGIADMTVTQNHWLIPEQFTEPDVPVKTYVNGELIDPLTGEGIPANVVIGRQAESQHTVALLTNLPDDTAEQDNK